MGPTTSRVRARDLRSSQTALPCALPYLAPEERRRSTSYDAWLRRQPRPSCASSTAITLQQQGEEVGLSKLKDELDCSFVADGSLADELTEETPARASDTAAAPRRSGSRLFAHRKFLVTHPGALEMIVPVDKIVSNRVRFHRESSLLIWSPYLQIDDLRLLQSIFSEGPEQFQNHERILALAKVQSQAAKANRKVMVKFLLACMSKPHVDALWRVVTWNTIFGVADEVIKRMSDEERATAYLNTHHG